MDNKEKISVELELLTEKFSNKIKTMTNKISSFGKHAKAHLTNIDSSFDLSGAEKDLEQLETALQKTNNPKTIQTLKTMISATKQDIKEYKDNLESAGNSSEKFGNSITKNFNKGISSVKKFALSLFSIRSIFSLVSRASSSYISHDTALANKLQAVWVGLGSLLEPLINSIANAMLKLVGYINAFVKGLTGADLLAKGINKSLNNAARNASNLVAPFDEISNINENSSGGGLDVSWVSAFDNIELNQKWVTYFEKLGKSLQSCSKWLPVIIGSASLLTGLSGINSLLGLIAAVGVITLTIMLKSNLEEANKGYEKMKDNNNQLVVSMDKLNQKWDERVQKLKEETEQQRYSTDSLNEYIDSLNSQISSNNRLIEGTLNIIDTDESLLKVRTNMIAKNQQNIDELKRLKEQYGLSKEQEEQYTNAIKKQIDMLTQQNKTIYKNSNEYKQNQKQIEGLQSSLEELTGQKYVINTELKAPATQNYENGLTRFFNGINTRINKWADGLKNWLSSLGGNKKLPSYDVGTNYVPNDQIAMVHKGEAIIPAKYNNNGYFNGTSEIVYQLDKLNNTLENKDMNTYLDGKVIGKTAQNYINSQSRIMGRSVI